MRRSATRVLVYAALLLALGSFGAAYIWAPDKLLEWFVAMSATTVAALLAVAGGVWLFHYQEQETEEKLEKKLAARFAVELKTNLETLDECCQIHAHSSLIRP